MSNEDIKFAESGSITVTDKGVTLPKRAARFVMLSNWNTDGSSELNFRDDGSNNLASDGGVDMNVSGASGLEVIWGFGGTFAHQLFAGQTTPLIPIADLQDVCLRCRTGSQVTIWYSFFS